MKGVFYLQWRRSRSGVIFFDSENCATDAPCRHSVVRSIGDFDTRNIICSAFESLPFLTTISLSKESWHVFYRGGLLVARLLQSLKGGRKFSGGWSCVT